MRSLADPKVARDNYGHICPGCLARYGDEQPGKMIDITRCHKCKKTLAEIHQYDEAIRSRHRHWRTKERRSS